MHADIHGCHLRTVLMTDSCVATDTVGVVNEHSCPGCAKNFSIGGDWGQHVTGCVTIKGGHVTRRHNNFAHAIRQEGVFAGAHVDPDEPRDLAIYTCPCGFGPASQERYIQHKNARCGRYDDVIHLSGPDIRMVINGKPYVFDTTILNMNNKTNKEHDVNAVFAAATSKKLASYQKLCDNAGCTLDFDAMPPGCTLIGGHTRNFIQVLQHSTFCAVLPGNGWGHIEEPAIHGCIPVVVMPGIHAQLEGVLDFERFALRVERHELPSLIDRLRAIPPPTLAAMQAQLRTVWERFTYSGLFKREYRLQLTARQAPPAERARLAARLGATSLEDQRVFGPMEPRLTGVDAVESLLEVLRHRLRARAEPSNTASLLVDHGPVAVPLRPLPGYRVRDTSGVQ